LFREGNFKVRVLPNTKPYHLAACIEVLDEVARQIEQGELALTIIGRRVNSTVIEYTMDEVHINLFADRPVASNVELDTLC